MNHAHRTGANFLADRATRGQHRPGASKAITLLGIGCLLLRFYGFWTRLQDVQFAVAAVLAPFNVHRTAIVFFDDGRVFGKLDDFDVIQRIAVTQFNWHVDRFDGVARLGFAGEFHLDQLGPDVAPDNRQLALLQHRFVDIEFVRIHRALHYRFAEAVAGCDEHHVLET